MLIPPSLLLAALAVTANPPASRGSGAHVAESAAVAPVQTGRAARDTTFVITGLAAPVRIVTDPYGIPHLHARDASDLYFAWGFVAARDRLWQLEHDRRSAKGEMWRWFGNRSLRTDGGAQLFELRTRAERIWERERRHDQVRVPLERYAAGVNEWIARCRRGDEPWPPEFERLGRRPDEWQPKDSILMLLSLGMVLDLALPELAEGDSVRRHGREWYERRRRFEADFMVPTVPDSVAARLFGRPARPTLPGRPFPSGTGSGARIDGADPVLRGAAERALGDWVAGAADERGARGSNWFAVGPKRSASGRAMFANDPHLALSTPNPLHVIHVSTEDGIDAIGASVPGLPAIVSGRNRALAWGITALSADVMDVYADTLSKDGRQVRYRGKWEPVREEPYTMRFKALRLVSLPTLGQSRRYTPHGPVVLVDRKRRLAYSVRWAGRDEDITLARMLGLERSTTAQEMAARFRTLVTPTLNVAAADTLGAVVYQAVGAVPDRGFDPPPGPLSGAGRYEWRRIVPPDSMPHWEAPRDGFIVNGNNLPIGSPFPIAFPRYDWPHDRAARMTQRLAGDSHITFEDLRSIQNDVMSLGAARLLPRLIAAAESVATTLSPRAHAALDTLRRWDYVARRDRVAPTLYRGWYGAFMRRSRIEGLPGLAAAALDGRAPEALLEPASTRPERAAAAAAAALELAITSMEPLLGADLATWTWDRSHRARMTHALSWRTRDFEPRPIGVDGDNSTPCVSTSRLPWSTTVGHAPVWKHLVDLAVRDRSWGVVTPGNTGAGPHRFDLLDRWANHGYVPLDLDWARLESEKEEGLTLKP